MLQVQKYTCGRIVFTFAAAHRIFIVSCVTQEKGGLAPAEAGLATTLKEMFSKLLDIVGSLLGGSPEGAGGSSPNKPKRKRAKTQGGGFKEAFEAKYGTRYVCMPPPSIASGAAPEMVAKMLLG